MRFYKNVRAEVLETAEQLKNLKTTALKVAGIEERGNESFDRVVSSQDNEISFDNRKVTNSNMLSDMMTRRGGPAGDFSVQDTLDNQMVEGTAKAWLQNQQNQFTPSPSTESWSQLNQVRGVRPSSESFGPPQPGSPVRSQFSQALGSSQSQMPFPGMQPSPLPSQTLYSPAFPGSLPQMNARSVNQPLPMRVSNQANVAAGPSVQSFSPRGFQQQMSSMPQPPAPNWSAQRPISQSVMPSANFAQISSQNVGLREQNRLNMPGVMLPPPGGMMGNRQQPGLSSPASQLPRFATQRMPVPSPQGTSGPQKLMQVSPQATGMSSQMQQQMMRPPQPSSVLPNQARLPPQMVRQNLRGSPQMASAERNFLHTPVLPMAPAQQTSSRPPQMCLAAQNFNRATPYDGNRPRMPAMQQSGGPHRPLGPVPSRPM